MIGRIKKMRFSIITPSHNQGRFIRDCIESVKNQELSNNVEKLQPDTLKQSALQNSDISELSVEHLIIDASSTDETITILEEYPHLVWVSEPDNGQTDAINKGFRRATGDWVMWLNADDYLLPSALVSFARFVNQNMSADVVYGDCQFVDEQRNLLRIKREPDYDFWMLVFYGCYIPSTATFLRRTIIDTDNLPDENLKVCMDYEYYLRLATRGFRFTHLPLPLAAFRWHGSNLSTLHSKLRMEERLRVQRCYLQNRAPSFLQNKLVLRCLRRTYQVKRTAWRVLHRIHRSSF